MSGITMEAASLMDILPEADQAFAYQFITKLVLAWDPDFTKVTDEEAKRIKEAEKSGYLDANEIDWDSIGVE